MEKTERELEVADAFALGRLDIAEQVGPVFGVGAAFLAYHFAESWLLAAVAFGAGWWLVVWPLRQAGDNADDAYHKAAGIGQYRQQDEA